MQDCIADGTVGRGTYLSIRTAAKILEISVSAFYQWRQSDYLHPHGVVHTDDRILTEVKAIINEHPTNEIPGVRVIYDNLQSKNIAIGFKRLRRLMRESYGSESAGFKCVNPNARKIVIIGGRGGMGKIFVNFFQNYCK